MTTDGLVKALRNYNYWLGSSGPASRDIHPPICDQAADAIEHLQRQLADVTRERDAAINDMKIMADGLRSRADTLGCCFACKYYDRISECPGYDADDCFAWRGSEAAK